MVDVPAGNGLIFMSTLSVETQPVGGEKAGGGYIEGCWQFYNSAATPCELITANDCTAE